MWAIVTMLWVRQSRSKPHQYRRFFISKQHLDWFRGQPSLIFNGYHEFFLQSKSGCSISNLTTHLHLELGLKISAIKLFLPICAIVTSKRKLQLYLYWLCACKNTQHSSLCNGKNQGRALIP